MKVEVEEMQCLHDDVDILEGENTCTCCGTILGSHIDEGAEWRMYSTTEDDPSRTGTITNELLPGSSYGSMMMRKRVPGQSEEAKTIAKLKNAKVFSSKLNWKVQTIFIKYLQQMIFPPKKFLGL